MLKCFILVLIRLIKAKRSVFEFYNRNPGTSSTLLLGAKSLDDSMLSEEFLHCLAKSPGAVSMNNMDLVVTIQNRPIKCFVQQRDCLLNPKTDQMQPLLTGFRLLAKNPNGVGSMRSRARILLVWKEF